MPDPDLICEVRSEGGTYRDWTSVAVTQDYSEAWMRKFRLTCAEPSQIKNLRLTPGDRVDIALAGRVVIEKGYIKTRQAAYDPNRHGVQIDGYSKAGLTLEGSVVTGTGQYRGYKVDAIARDVLKPLGLKFRVENGPKDWDLPFPQVMVRKGESPFSMIARLCTQRGLWLQADAKGDLVAGPKDAGAPHMSASPIRLATENGKRVGRTSKAKRLAAGPATEVARLRRCIARIKAEGEKHQARTARVEATLRTLMDAAFRDDPILVRAMAREVSIEVPAAMNANFIVRFCEMAEECTLCA